MVLLWKGGIISNFAIYGLKNGKRYIKEYNFENILIYEGEYKNGDKNGKGQEFYYDGMILFKVEYYKGKKRNGKGYNIDGNIIYEIKNGKEYIKKYEY